MTGPLEKLDTEIKEMVVPCRSAYCFGRYRVRGLEYDTGGCLSHDLALRIARDVSEIGIEKWRRLYATRLDGSPKL